MDQANLLEFSIHEAWSSRLLKARMDEPPPGYAGVSWSQLEAADRKLFAELADATRNGVQATAAGRP